MLRSAEDVTLYLKTIKGLRVWWKKVSDPSFIHNAKDMAGVTSVLEKLQKNVGLLEEHLLFGHGLALPSWADLDEKLGVKPSYLDEFRARIPKLIEQAKSYLGEGIDYNNWLLEIVTPGTYAYTEGRGTYRDVQKKHEENPAKFLDGAKAAAQGKVALADKEISGKLFRMMTAFLNEHDPTGEGLKKLSLPIEANIGKVKVVFEGGQKALLSKGLTRRDPRDLDAYLPYLIEAKQRLSSKGFDDLWYGPIFIQCEECGGKNPLGASFGVGAHYFHNRDYIFIYMDPQRAIVPLVIHELGHRMYYKFLDLKDRSQFNSYFGKVPATSKYGDTTPSEDFAEVFSSFIMGRDLTRDQIERFKAFLGKQAPRVSRVVAMFQEIGVYRH